MLNAAAIIKNIGHETSCANSPLVAENTSRAKLINDESSAYWVAVYRTLHSDEM